MPAYTEARIKRLCDKALSVSNEVELAPVLKQLQWALHEHLRLANETLGAQASVIPVLENYLKQQRVEKKTG